MLDSAAGTLARPGTYSYCCSSVIALAAVSALRSCERESLGYRRRNSSAIARQLEVGPPVECVCRRDAYRQHGLQRARERCADGDGQRVARQRLERRERAPCESFFGALDLDHPFGAGVAQRLDADRRAPRR